MHQEVIVFNEDICLIIMEFIGGKQALGMRGISRAWLEASKNFKISLIITDKNNPKQILQCVDHIMMEYVDQLSLIEVKLERKDYEKISKIPYWKNLKLLHLEKNSDDESVNYGGLFGDDTEDNDDDEYQLHDRISLFTESKILSKLEKLVVIGHDIGNEGLSHIFKTDIKLKSLVLHDNNFSRFGEITQECKSLKGLTELELKYQTLSLSDVEQFASNSNFENLKILTIGGYASYSMQFLVALLTSKILVNVTELNINALIDKSIENVKSNLKLEKLNVKPGTFENCSLLVGNKSICESLKTLQVNEITVSNSDSIEALEKLGKGFEHFIYAIQILEEESDEDIGFGLFGSDSEDGLF